VSGSYDMVVARAAAAFIQERTSHRVAPRIALILGSGLGAISDDVADAVRVAYRDIPGFPSIQVSGHSGEVVLGHLEGLPVIVFAGRVHCYEGHSAAAAAFPARVAYACGARTLFVSHAAGGINQSFDVGDMMVIDDHLNLSGLSALVGPVNDGEPRFPDMSAVYDVELRSALYDAAGALGLVLRRGVFASLLGPAYETPAEIRMLRTLGADTVCMSTVHEVTAARSLGMRIAGVSCVTNLASGVSAEPLDHADVLRATERMSETFRALVRRFVADTGRMSPG
jgi:purine-nucleoside phosphorylase